MTSGAHTLLTAALWVSLGGWVGAMVLFGAVVAPALFEVLPSTELAGQVVERVLGALNLYGVAAGLALAALAHVLDRGRIARLLPIALAVLCLISHFGVSAELERISDAAFADPPDPLARQRFGMLHGVSMLLFLVTGFGAMVLAFVHARSSRA